MRARLASLALLVLAGCDDMPRARTEGEIRRIAADESAATVRLSQDLESRVIELERRANKADADIQGVRLLGIENSDNHKSLWNTVNNNVDQENRYLAKQMTARGGCGTELVTYPGGATAWRNRECTVKDLK